MTRASESFTGIAVEGTVRVLARTVRVRAYGRDWFDAVAVFGREVERAYGRPAIADYARGIAAFDRSWSWMDLSDKAGRLEVAS